jgi:hypothetical protein
VENPPKPGALAGKREVAPGITELVFSNGLKAVLKPTEFKKDEILMSAWAPGGYSVLAAEDYLSARYAADIVGGLIIGVLENLSGGYLDRVFGGGVKEVAPFVFLVIILMIKPYGLFGTKEIERV